MSGKRRRAEAVEAAPPAREAAKRTASRTKAAPGEKQATLDSFARVRRARGADGAKKLAGEATSSRAPSPAKKPAAAAPSTAASRKKSKAEEEPVGERFDTAGKRARGVLVRERGVPPPKYKVITRNFYLVQAPTALPKDEILECDCRPGDGRPGACGEGCENRRMLQECVKGHCRHGEACLNQRFQRCQYARVEVFHTKERGWGARALEPVPAGAFVVEYAGEVIDEEEMERRAGESEDGAAYYFMRLNGPYIIDAGPRSTYARFLNHACDPNCITRKWTVGSEERVGIFALRDVAVGEELTYDYQTDPLPGMVRQKCLCGSAKCRGFLNSNVTSAR